MKNSGRKRFNRKVVALVLALAMLFSQNALVYATEGADPVSGNETVEAPAQTPAAEEAAEPAPETPAGEEAAESETPAKEEAPAENEEAAKPASDGEASNEEAEVSGDEAETVSENEDEAEPEEASASVNKISDNTVSLSGGQIVVSINDAGKVVSEDLLEYAEGVTVSQSKIDRFVGDPIGFDFKVISLNNVAYGESGNIILKEGTDYKVTWMYEADGWGVSQNVTKDYKSEDPGKITVVIEGLSENDAATGYKGYRNSIRIELMVTRKPVGPVTEDDIKLVLVSYNRVTVSNNSKKNLFVTVVSRNGVPADMIVQGDYIAPGTHKTIYSYYTGINKKANITENLPLAVVASYDSEFVINTPVTSVYVPFTSAKNTGGSTGAPEDGFEKINMKAVVSKSTQTIKVTWKPAKSLGYKYYELQRLGKNEETFTTLEGWKDKNGNTKLAKTAYTYGKKDVERAVQPAVFQLICYDKDKAEKARYITVAAPSLLYVEQGYDTNNMEYCFSKLYEDNDFAYRLELAEKNVENGKDEAGKRGFKQTAGKASIYYSTDMTEIKDFKVNSKVSVNALRDFFIGDEDLKLNPGTAYYCRVKSVYSWHGKDYTSAPSNVVSRKAGPSKVYVFDVNGRKYTKPAGKNKEAIEAENVKNMTSYLDQVFGGNENIDISALSSDGFIHKGNMGPDAKSGYVVFMADRISDNKLKGFELLRSDTQYGNYKKLKLYKIGGNDEPVKYSGLYKWTPTNPEVRKLFEESGIDVYYMQYNKFPPEKPYYYAVRGVYKKGNALGGFGDGYECTAELDDIQSFYGFDGTIDKINLYWKYDACVKEYWIYKKDYKDGTNPEDFGNISDYKLLKKVKGKKTGTLKENSKKASDQDLIVATSGNLIGDYVKFTDKDNTKYFDKSKNEVKEGKNYQYVVVPKYYTKKSDVNYNLEKRSRVVCAMATLANAKVKNFKASNYGVNRISLKWSKLKGASEYLMLRTTTDPRQSDDWKNIEGWVISPQASDPKYQKAYANCGFVDNTVTVGTTYYYLIFAGSERSETITNASLKSAKSVPLAVTDIKVEQKGYRSGATVSWTKNSRDNGYAVKYIVQSRQADNGSGSYSAWKTLTTTSHDHYDDNRSLDRGDMRQYRVISVFEDVHGGIKEGGKICTPTYIDISTGSTSMAVGETMTINVYPKRDGSPSSVTNLRMDGVEGAGGVVSVTGSKTEGDHVVYTIRANERGTARLTFKVYDSGWTSHSSSDKLKKTVTITVR